MSDANAKNDKNSDPTLKKVGAEAQHIRKQLGGDGTNAEVNSAALDAAVALHRLRMRQPGDSTRIGCCTTADRW